MVVQIYNAKYKYTVHAIPFMRLSSLLLIIVTMVAFISSCSLKFNHFFLLSVGCLTPLSQCTEKKASSASLRKFVSFYLRGLAFV